MTDGRSAIDMDGSQDAVLQLHTFTFTFTAGRQGGYPFAVLIATSRYPYEQQIQYCGTYEVGHASVMSGQKRGPGESEERIGR